MQNYAFLQHLITEDIYLVPETSPQKEAPPQRDNKLPDPPAEPQTPAFYGKNKQQIVLLTNEAGKTWFSEEHEPLLKNILEAIRLTFDDVALINVNNLATDINLETLTSLIGCKKLIAFGVDIRKIIPSANPSQPPIEQNGVRILFTYSLKELMNNRNNKKALWDNLKAMFNI